jgi:hypothetical protein
MADDKAKKQSQLNALIQQELDLVEQLNRELAKSAPNEQKIIALQRQKIKLGDKINNQVGITERGMKKVGVETGAVVNKGKELAKVFKSYDKPLANFAKGNKFAAGQIQAIAGFQDLAKNNVTAASQAQDKLNSLKEAEALYGAQRNDAHKQAVAKYQSELSIANQINNVMGEMSSETQQSMINEAGRGSRLMESLSTVTAQEALLEAELAFANEKNNLSGQGLALAQANIDALRKGVDVLEEQKMVTDMQIAQRDAMTDAIIGPFESLKSTIDSFPGGSYLSGALGLDVFNDKMKEIIQISIQKGLAGGVEQGIGSFRSLTAQTKIFGMSLKSALLPLLVVGALVGAVMLFSQMSKETEELSKNTGLSARESEKMMQSARGMQASSSNSLANTEEIVGAMSALTTEFGSTANFSEETALNIANMSAAFGIAVGDAAAVQAQFEAMGQTSEEAFNTQALTANLAEAAGVAPGKVMADIAKSSKKAAKYMGGNVNALAKAAVEAARLGMELGDMVDVADGLLDIESSIEAEFEASVMLGKTINMDLARQLALQGDIEGATKEVLNQVGSIHEFNKMDVLQRKKLAQAAGMEVGQLQSALKKQEQMNNLTEEQKKRYDEATKALEGQELTGEQLVAQQEQALAAKEMAATFNKIKNTLMKALYPVIQAITAVFTNVLSPILEVIGGIFKGFMFALTPIIWIVKAIAIVFEKISPVLKAIAATLGVIYGIKALMWIGDKAALAIEKTRLLFSSRQNMLEGARNVLKFTGLISDKQSIANKGRETMLQNSGNAAVLQNNLYKNQGLLTQLKTNALAVKDWFVAKGRAVTEGLKNTAIKLGNALGLTGLGTAQATGVTEKASLVTRIASNVQRAAAWAWEGMINLVTGQGWIIEKGKAAVKAVTAMWTQQQIASETSVAAIQSKGLLKTIGGAAMAAYKSAAAIPGIGWILGAAAAAAVIGLGMSFMSDGIVSGKSGGSGYGDRVLYGPEGAISFNNKDTIVAGTNLNYGNDVISKGRKANDAVFKPAGALKMDDGTIGPGGGMGNMPDPPESKIVDFSSKAFKKLVVANMIGSNPFLGMMGGLSGGLGSILGGEDEEGEEAGKPVHDATAAEKLDAMLSKLDEVVTAIASNQKGAAPSNKPVQIVIGNKVIEEIASQTKVNTSYAVSAGNAGEEG